MGQGYKEGWALVVATDCQIIGNRRQCIAGAIHAPILASLAQHPEAIWSYICTIDAAGLRDTTAGSHKKVDQRTVAQVAEALPWQSCKQLQDRFCGHWMRVSCCIPWD